MKDEERVAKMETKRKEYGEKMEEEAKVKQIFGEKKPKNEFEEWCTRSLQAMQAQV